MNGSGHIFVIVAELAHFLDDGADSGVALLGEVDPRLAIPDKVIENVGDEEIARPIGLRMRVEHVVNVKRAAVVILVAASHEGSNNAVLLNPLLSPQYGARDLRRW